MKRDSADVKEMEAGAAYTPASLGADGKFYSQNAGHLFVIGKRHASKESHEIEPLRSHNRGGLVAAAFFLLKMWLLRRDSNKQRSR
jgi:hypothetical protein